MLKIVKFGFHNLQTKGEAYRELGIAKAMYRVTSLFLLSIALAGCESPTNLIEITSAYDGPFLFAIDATYRDDYVVEERDRVFKLGLVPILCVSSPDVLIPEPKLMAIRKGKPEQDDIVSLGASSATRKYFATTYGQSLVEPGGTHIVWAGVGDESLNRSLQQEHYAGTLYRRFDQYWKSDWPGSVADHVKTLEFHKYVRNYCTSSTS